MVLQLSNATCEAAQERQKTPIRGIRRFQQRTMSETGILRKLIADQPHSIVIRITSVWPNGH
jgi:hypothetical protein